MNILDQKIKLKKINKKKNSKNLLIVKKILVKKFLITLNRIVRLILINIDKLKRQEIIQNFIQIFMKNQII